MADKYFDNWDSLVQAVSGTASKILKKDVAPVAEDILIKHIKSDIYDVYTPKTNGWVTSNGVPTTYTRRHILESSVVSYLIGNNDTLLITSRATASPSVVNGYSFRNRYDGSFLKLLESGNMGIWRGGFPRPAVKNTQAEIDGSRKITSAIRQGIQREIGKCFEI